MSFRVPMVAGPGGYGGIDEKLPVPPEAKNSPIPSCVKVAVGHVTPANGVAGFIGQKSRKCMVLLPLAKLMTPAATVPKLPLTGAALAIAQSVSENIKDFIQPVRRLILMTESASL